MTKKTRLMILLVCVVCFFVISPLLVAYSMGYRFDFDKMKVTETGGIYVRTFPAADQITIDSNISQKPGLFSNWIFVQSLMPKDHSVLVKKNRYYDYSKTIPVQEKEVTKLENILLIKTLIGFKSFAGQIDYFSTSLNNQNIITATANEKDITISYHPLTSNKPIEAFSIAQTGKVSGIKWSNDSSKALIEIQSYNNNFYYLFDSALLAQITKTKPVIARLTYLDKKTTQVSFNPQDSQQLFFIKNNVLYSIKNNKTLAVIKNLTTYKFSGNNITWLSADGLLYNSDITGKLIEQLTIKNTLINPGQNYQIFILPKKTLLQIDNSLFSLNPDKKTLEDITPPETNYKIIDSLDENNNLNLILWNQNKIYLYSFVNKKFEKIFSGSNITDCQWVNNSYIIFTEGDLPAQAGKIIISEIDYRGNINTVTLPQTITLPSDPNITINIKNPEIYFNQQEGKIYLMTNNTLLSSDKITP